MGYYGVITAKPRSEWMAQAHAANDVMQAKGYKDLNEFADRDSDNCRKLLQAMDALGYRVDPALVSKCGLKTHLTEEEVG